MTTQSATSAAGTLRRLLRDEQPPTHVWLITDEHQSLPLAARGKEYYETLRQHGAGSFRHLELTFEQIGELDGLQAVVGLARAGDLEIEPRPVSEAEVIASHHRWGRYRSAPVLRELVCQVTPV